MSQSFSVNGKEYIQSSTLAATFGYTPDYIGKLARDEKILGTQVGRQWFIEPESLKIFLQKAQIEKDLRKSALSSQRKKEHATHQKKVLKKTDLVPSSVLASLQAVTIVLCGLFFGGLSWVTVSENVALSEIGAGMQKLAVILGDAVIPAGTVRTLQEDSFAFLATSVGQEGGATLTLPSLQMDTYQQAEIFAQLPQSFGMTEANVLLEGNDEKVPSVSVHTPDIEDHFSDEVLLVVDAEGNELIAPVFKSQSSSTQFFRLVPVAEPLQ
jgi:hypothetical protein